MTQHNMVRATMPTEKELRRARVGNPKQTKVRMHYTVSDQPYENIATPRRYVLAGSDRLSPSFEACVAKFFRATAVVHQ